MMHTYEVSVMLGGRSWAEVIRATSAGAAMAAVRQMLPGATIFGARQID